MSSSIRAVAVEQTIARSYLFVPGDRPDRPVILKAGQIVRESALRESKTSQ